MTIQANELASVVLQKINEEVPDALEIETKLMNILSTSGKKSQKGGLLIQCPIKLLVNTAKGAISGTGASLDLTPSAQLQYMTFNWKYYYFGTNFTLADYNIAESPLAVVDFMEEKISGSAADAARDWSVMINSSSNTAIVPATNPLQFDGLLDWEAQYKARIPA